jgi:tetratricopeptide (TPR) repeat protein
MIILRIKECIKNKKFEEALDLIEEIPENYLTSEFYLLKGICIQLSDSEKYTLHDAENSFHKALELEPNNIDIKLELAWLYFNVLDEPKKAERYFKEALENNRIKLVETVEGIIKIALDTDKFTDLNGFLKEYSNLIISDSKIKSLLEENKLLIPKKVIYSVK